MWCIQWQLGAKSYFCNLKKIKTTLREKIGIRRASVSYCQTISQSPAKQPRLERSSSTESCETMDFEDLPAMSSSNEAENDTTAASAQESTHEKEQEKRDSTCRGSTNVDQTTTKQSENKEIRFKDEDEEEEFSTSLSVADGHHLVDLGSSSEFIVDEECILELFKSCQKCNRRCTITKNIQGLKLVVYQTCCFCQNYFEWSNLPDEDDKPDIDLQIEGQNTATSPSSNRS
ncbi:uncharacterized protein LOC121637809 isoform X2 [Melanotaenia boesemani]|uniref:uncharacterized protein LOC121637809 isoform X2 n=1 Tax=Melanotaenia boesemani TaxID=1250792 RepID=UPI001C059FE9|nr:uncharacterized protein LOC121637809 isoform X2 [Melanotaenia boesemani]